VKLTLVVDGQSPGKRPLVEVHNPTAKTIASEIYSPPHTPLWGGLRTAVTLPPGQSAWFRIESRQLRKQ